MAYIASLLSQLNNPWVFIGLFGQFVFFMRFVVQWLASEKKKEVVIPRAFWYLSIGGALITLVYSLYIKDLVFILAQTFSLVIYTRNLMIEHKIFMKATEKPVLG
jgi:lipid-A-disaccharide synthase-like uncharacterized protein